MPEGMNRVFLLGNLGADPELRVVSGGRVVLNMRLATDRNFPGRDGVWRSDTTWHRVAIWGRRAEGLYTFLQKGDRVYVEGSLQTRSYEKNGEKRYATTVVARNIIFVRRPGECKSC